MQNAEEIQDLYEAQSQRIEDLKKRQNELNAILSQGEYAEYCSVIEGVSAAHEDMLNTVRNGTREMIIMMGDLLDKLSTKAGLDDITDQLGQSIIVYAELNEKMTGYVEAIIKENRESRTQSYKKIAEIKELLDNGTIEYPKHVNEYDDAFKQVLKCSELLREFEDPQEKNEDQQSKLSEVTEDYFSTYVDLCLVGLQYYNKELTEILVTIKKTKTIPDDCNRTIKNIMTQVDILCGYIAVSAKVTDAQNDEADKLSRNAFALRSQISRLVIINEVLQGKEESEQGKEESEQTMYGRALDKLRQSNDKNYEEFYRAASKIEEKKIDYPKDYESLWKAYNIIVANNNKLVALEDPELTSEASKEKRDEITQAYVAAVNTGLEQQYKALRELPADGKESFQKASEIYLVIEKLRRYITANLGEKLSEKNEEDFKGARVIVKSIQSPVINDQRNVFVAQAEEILKNNTVTQENLQDLKDKYNALLKQIDKYHSGVGEDAERLKLKRGLTDYINKCKKLPIVENDENRQVESIQTEQSNKSGLRDKIQKFVTDLSETVKNKEGPQYNDAKKNAMIKEFIDDIAADEAHFEEPQEILSKMIADLNTRLESKINNNERKEILDQLHDINSIMSGISTYKRLEESKAIDQAETVSPQSPSLSRRG